MTAQEQLLDVYRKAYVRILIDISKTYQEGIFSKKEQYKLNYQNDILNNVKKEINLLDVNSERFCKIVMKKVYEETQQKELLRLFNAYSVKKKESSFAVLNKDAIKLLSNDLQKSLQTVNNALLENSKEIIKTLDSIVIEGALKKVTTDIERSKVFKETIDELVNTGITSFIDEAGRRWTLENYVTMAVHTRINEAVNTAILNTAEELEVDLVRMSDHATSCPVCAVYEGRIYSISGKDKIFPKLNIVYKEYNVIHPRCRHRLTLYIIEGERDNIENDIKKSNRPFEDTRSDSRKQLYTKRLEAKAIDRKLERINEKITILEKSDGMQKQTRMLKAKKAILNEEARKYKKVITEWKVD